LHFLSFSFYMISLHRVRSCARQLVLFLLMSGSLLAQAETTIKGAGATFPSKVYERWMQRFQAKHTEVQLSYAATGSGDGVRQIKAATVDFGGTDSPLDEQALATHHLVQIPMLVGGLVPVVNLRMANNAQAFVLSGPVLSDIMLGRIMYWNDPRIAQLNPRINLPQLAVTRVVRSDSSGSSELFTRYLGMVSANFKGQVPPSQLPAWPNGSPLIKAKGNDGVVDAIKSTVGSIAYVSYDRAIKDNLMAVHLLSQSGKVVKASEASFRAAMLASDVYRKGDDNATLLNMPNDLAWPITATSFVLLSTKPKDASRAYWSTRFVLWCFLHGDDLTKSTGFTALPTQVQAKLIGRLQGIRRTDGQRALPLSDWNLVD
jgi:phosphate transport system substrate-binding protein